MSLWRRVRHAFDFGARQQVTRMGLLFTLTCVLVALAAFSSANNLLFLILAAMLSTLMISDFISRLSLAGLALDFITHEHLCARRKLVGRVVLQNEKRWIPSFSIHVSAPGNSGFSVPLYFPVIPGGARLEEPVELYFERRGSYRENNFRFATRFPFGFAERRLNVLVRREVIVYPSIDPQPGFEQLLISLNGEIESFFRGQGHDFYRIRPYEALESARHVDWKATAHIGELQVREFAREQERSVALFLDLHVPGIDLDVPEPALQWFERAVDCCAYLAWNMTQRGVRLRFFTQQVDHQIPERADIYTMLRYLAIVTPARGSAASALPSAQNNDENVFQVVFSLSPGRLSKAGWDLEGANVCLLGPDLDSGPLSRSATGTSEDFHHSHIQHLD
ncbi:MAG: DUF58 domain-containing protein [Acidobacteriota bacterium]|nr:DUF58 domain-containing protein [Acidobacteriota bacterium]